MVIAPSEQGILTNCLRRFCFTIECLSNVGNAKSAWGRAAMEALRYSSLSDTRGCDTRKKSIIGMATLKCYGARRFNPEVYRLHDRNTRTRMIRVLQTVVVKRDGVPLFRKYNGKHHTCASPELTNLNIAFLPRNTINHLHLLGVGTVRALKCLYRRQMAVFFCKAWRDNGKETNCGNILTSPCKVQKTWHKLLFGIAGTALSEIWLCITLVAYKAQLIFCCRKSD